MIAAPPSRLLGESPSQSSDSASFHPLHMEAGSTCSSHGNSHGAGSDAMSPGWFSHRQHDSFEEVASSLLCTTQAAQFQHRGEGSQQQGPRESAGTFAPENTEPHHQYTGVAHPTDMAYFTLQDLLGASELADCDMDFATSSVMQHDAGGHQRGCAGNYGRPPSLHSDFSHRANTTPVASGSSDDVNTALLSLFQTTTSVTHPV